ncbi:MAG TPA: site-specific integrase, partial [Verrucomicrobiae bacterium]|nr:site-specific integrase [Verrucomicrobiae bacterium]
MKTVYNADGVEFTIYETVKKTKAGPIRYWLLEDHSSGKRRLLSNKTKEAAQKRADKIRAAMVKGRADRMTLSNGQWQDVCLAGEIVKSLETGDSLISAVREWAHCRALLLSSGATLVEAAQFYRTHHKGGGGPGHNPTRFDDAAPAYHQSKIRSGQSQSHCKNILTRLGRMKKVLPEGVLLDDLTAGQLDTALLTLDIGAKTRNEYRLILSNFYKWAGKQNPPLVPAGFNPGKEMEQHRVGHQEIEFLCVADLRKVLAGVQSKRPDLLMLVALISFAGIRPSECVRLEWQDIGEDYIRLPGRKTKTRYARQVPIQHNLRRWL